jgi:membrane-associated HD superfamily phosphohydrolase
MFAEPAINVVISMLIMLVLLNYFSVYVVRGSSDMYMEINDPEFELLVKIKEKDRHEYYAAIHTAYLAERIGQELGLNRRMIKTCSYYHNVGILAGRPEDVETADRYYTDYNFPKEAVELLNEYIISGKNQPVSQEATIVSLCEELVRQIMDIFAKDSKARLDTDSLIDDILDKKTAYGVLHSSRLPVSDLYRIRKLLKKEKLYYDFLR